MEAVQKYIDDRHDAIIKFGGLFVLFFLILYVPMRIEYSMREQLDAHIANEIEMQAQIDHLNSQMSVYKAVYAKQQSVQREVQCLARNIYFEAASEPRAGKIAVAEVTMNRVKQGFAKTVCGVVSQKSNGVCQFSWVCEPKKKITMNSEWKEAREIAENILISQKKYSTIDGAMFFHADYVKPSWARTKDFVKKIGRHMFYREEMYANN
jgi:spore germination cell wall hydrolase CwlJ-like protein